MSFIQASRYSKMEKADVLEMTVTFLKAMQQKDTRIEGKISLNVFLKRKQVSFGGNNEVLITAIMHFEELWSRKTQTNWVIYESGMFGRWCDVFLLERFEHRILRTDVAKTDHSFFTFTTSYTSEGHNSAQTGFQIKFCFIVH